MVVKRFPLNDPSFLMQTLFAQGAGLELAGESGSGKSESLLAILRCVLRYLHFAVLIDPDNDTAEALHRICLADPQLARRTLYFHFSDPQQCGTFDPMGFVESEDPLINEARRTNRIEHFIKIILAAWGETDLNSRPVLAKNLYRILETCSRYALPFAEAERFFDVKSPLYPILCSGVANPIDRSEMLELSTMRPVDRDGQIASSQNRIQTILRNPMIPRMLSKTRHSGAFDFEQAYEQGRILIFNVHRGTTLRTTDQQMIANMILASVVDVVMTRPLGQRKQALIGIEEMPVFRSSEELLTNTVARIRKFNARFAMCHQGVHTFEGGLDSSFLALIRGTCKAHLQFRTTHESDAMYTAKQIKLPSIKMKSVKFEHWDYEQYQKGNEVVTLTDQSQSTATAQQHGGSDALGKSNTNSHTNSMAEHTDAETLIKSAIVSAQANASSNGITQTSTNSWSNTTTQTQGTTFKQTLVPILAWRKVLRMLDFWTTEEQYQEMATTLAQQKVGQGILFFNGLGAQQYQFPLLPKPFARTPKFAAKKIAQHLALQLERPEFDSVANIDAYRQRFLENLIVELQRIPITSEKLGQLLFPLLPPGATEPPPIIDPDEDEDDDGPWSL